MSIKTMNDVYEHAFNDACEALDSLALDCSLDVDDIAQELRDQVDCNSYAPEVIYYSDAWEIVAGSEFNAYSAEDLDFSHCQTALDCVMQEANQLVYFAYGDQIAGACEEIAKKVYEVIEQALEIGADESCDVRISSGYLFGWMAHNRESENGVAIYDDKAGFYNPEKVEGELYAVEGKAGNSCVSVCWNPSDY